MKPEPDPVSNLKARARPEPENLEPVPALIRLAAADLVDLFI